MDDLDNFEENAWFYYGGITKEQEQGEIQGTPCSVLLFWIIIGSSIGCILSMLMMRG